MKTLIGNRTLLDGTSQPLVADRQALELLKTRLELLAPAPTPAQQAAA